MALLPAPGDADARRGARRTRTLATETPAAGVRRGRRARAPRRAASWRATPGLRLIDQTKLVTAVSELARNTVVHGGGGRMSRRARWSRAGATGVWASSRTTGPGSPTSTRRCARASRTGDGPRARPRRRQAARRTSSRCARHRGGAARPSAWSHGADRAGAAARSRSRSRRRARPPRRRALADELGLDERLQRRGGDRRTELATNLVRHAGGGEVVLRPSRDLSPTSWTSIAWDRGPGHAPTSRGARATAYSTVGGPGNGLGAIGRLSATFDLQSTPGRGTVARRAARRGATRRRGRRARARDGGRGRPCGDAWAPGRATARCVTILLADGLGHGADAARAAGRRRARAARRTSTPDAAARAHARRAARRRAAPRRRSRGSTSRRARCGSPGSATSPATIVDGADDAVARLDERHPRPQRPPDPGLRLRARRPAALLVMHSDGVPQRLGPARATPGSRGATRS